MEIRVWRSYSCNNSSAYRMVARFLTEDLAKEAAADLLAFFAEATPLMERRPKKGSMPKTTHFPATDAMDRLATEHGFDWSQLLTEGIYDDELEVITEGTTLVAYHPYCLGLGKELGSYFRARGGEDIASRAGAPQLSVRFRLPEDAGEAQRVRDELTTLFAQAAEHPYVRAWPIKPPWVVDDEASAASEQTAFFCDGELVAFHLPFVPNQLPPLKEYLHERNARDMSLTLCKLSDLSLFKAIASARCPHCAQGDTPTLRYLHHTEHGLENDQLACRTCGGMFDLSLFE